MRAGLAILQKMSPDGSIQQRRCDTNKRQNSNATTQQSTVRRRRSIEGCSRSDCTTAQSLAQVGCCLGAVNVIDRIMVDVSSILWCLMVFEGRAWGGGQDRRSMRRLNCGEGRVTLVSRIFLDILWKFESSRHLRRTSVSEDRWSSVPKQLN